MLYDYASAWRGSKKVRATMKSVCTILLDDLNEKRKVRKCSRSLDVTAHILIGHRWALKLFDH